MSKKFFYERELTEYPLGGMRAWLLFIVILANFIAAYEAQIAPVVPMLLDGLHMELHDYGLISAISVIVAGFSALIFGPVADKYGRVRLLVPSLFLTAICVFAMVFVHSVTGLLIVRVLLGFVEGVSISSTAGLVRDFSPRMSRALAYAFWTFGPVGSNFFANALAGWTLPIFGTWQSQFVIQGSIAFVSAVLIMLFISDLSPQLRDQVVASKESAMDINKIIKDKKDTEVPKMREIMKVPRIWTLSIGISLFLVTYLTLQSFGATLLAQGFHLTNSEAASVAKYFWLLNLLTLVIAGYISDKLKLRKIVSFVGAIGAVIYMMYFASLIGTELSVGQLMVHTSCLGALIGIGYGPWMALYSENAEDIKASLQSAAWGFWGFAIRVVGVAGALITPIVVEEHGWGTWMWIAAFVGVIYIPLVFTAKGPWFNKRKNDDIVAPPTDLTH